MQTSLEKLIPLFINTDHLLLLEIQWDTLSCYTQNPAIIIDHLKNENVLNEREVYSLNAMTSESEQMEQLLETVSMKPDTAFDKLLDVLQKTGKHDSIMLPGIFLQ